jgi:hypothetical protein
VAGSTGPAKQATLKILVGAEKELFEKVWPVLETMGDAVFHMGEVGKGAITKLLINANLGIQMAALGETLAMGQELGLNMELLLETINASAVATVVSRLKGPSMLERNYPVAFPYEHQTKDLRYASQLSTEPRKLQLTRAARDAYAEGFALDLQRKDLSAILERYLDLQDTVPTKEPLDTMENIRLRDELMAIEHLVWKATEERNVEFYDRILTGDSLVVSVRGIGDRQAILDEIENNPNVLPIYELDVPRVIRLGDRAAILSYKAKLGEDEEVREVLVSTSYVREGAGWKLAFHQQTPLPS